MKPVGEFVSDAAALAIMPMNSFSIHRYAIGREDPNTFF
jgi:hypothetical protein